MVLSNFSTMQQQQQQQNQEQQQEDYIAAQRAAVESILTARETLQVATAQGEQLDRTVELADETQYSLDKAGRVLRGMTWSGWLANKFSRDVVAPSNTSNTSTNNAANVNTSLTGRGITLPKLEYETLPAHCQETAQSIQNYYANVKVLIESYNNSNSNSNSSNDDRNEQREQLQTLNVICNEMYKTAQQKIDQMEQNAYVKQFRNDLSTIHKHQEQISHVIVMNNNNNSPSQPLHDSTKTQLLGQQSAATNSKANSIQQDPLWRQQDEHLEFMSTSLDEMGLLANTLNKAMVQQVETMNSLDDKADNIVEKTKMVTRRADRIIQKKSWTPVKPTFHRHVVIRHVATGNYVTVVNNTVLLLPVLHKHNSVFGLWKRQGEIFGLQCRCNRKWMGQGVFGALTCSASTFGRREEWEASFVENTSSNNKNSTSASGDGATNEHDNKDNNINAWSRARLLCASAGWGAGGYLQVSPQQQQDEMKRIQIGGCTVQDRDQAAIWCIQDYHIE